jgi:hypothetical protein
VNGEKKETLVNSTLLSIQQADGSKAASTVTLLSNLEVYLNIMISG